MLIEPYEDWWTTDEPFKDLEEEIKEPKVHVYRRKVIPNSSNTCL